MGDAVPPPRPTSRAIATWTFSEVGVRACAAALLAGATALDAVVGGVRAVELDPAVTSVGYGGLPTAAGELELDAAVMTGAGGVGAVAALPGCRAAAPVARAVLCESRHSMLAGHGARDFAVARGLGVAEGEALLTEHARRRLREYLEGRVCPSKYSPNLRRMESTSAEDNLHTDTVGMICIDGAGEIAACCATSGLEFKAGGRVGDAPLIGAGVYADGAVGAAVASGEGDKMLRFCVAFLVVEEMRRGASAQAACDAAVGRVRDGDPTCQAAVCALDARTGESGAACTREGFKVVVWEEGDLDEPRVVAVPGCSPATPWKHTCV